MKYSEAISYLEKTHFPVEINPVPRKKIPACPQCYTGFNLDVKWVDEWHEKGRQLAIEYFGQWGLTDKDVDEHLLGYSEKHKGFTIPHWWLQKSLHSVLQGVKIRHNTTEKNKRFSCIDGSRTSGVFNQKWITAPDLSRSGPQLNHIYILEAEKDAILLDGLGFPAISFARSADWEYYLNNCFMNVVQPVFIYDNDGGIGLHRAKEISEFIRSDCQFICTMDYKSPSDMAKALGRDRVYRWMRYNDFEPEP
jgi:hypothetical protein